MKGAENMDYKKAVSDTLNGMKGSFRPESDAEFGRKIRERAKIMSNNNDNVRHITAAERLFWNNKINCNDAVNENNLILNRN